MQGRKHSASAKVSDARPSQSLRMISEAVGISIGKVQKVMVEDLKAPQSLSAKIVPKILSDDQHFALTFSKRLGLFIVSEQGCHL